MLAIANKHLQSGRTAEIVRGGSLSVTLTRIAGKDGTAQQDFLLSVSDEQGLVAPACMRVKGRGFDLAECQCDARGFSQLAHKIIELSSTIPCVSRECDLAGFATRLPAYHDLAQCRAVIVKHGLLTRTDRMNTQRIIRAGFSAVSLPNKSRRCQQTAAVATAAACESIFKYNAKMLSRIVSQGSPLSSAQGQLLNMAALHGLKPECGSVGLAVSMEVIAVPGSVMRALEAKSRACSGACGRVSLVTDQALRLKMPVWKLDVTPELRTDLAAVGLQPRKGVTAVLVAFNEHDMPIVTDVAAVSGPEKAESVELKTEAETRRWLAAAASTHAGLAPVLGLCSEQAAVNFKSHVTTPAQCALDFWYHVSLKEGV